MSSNDDEKLVTQKDRNQFNDQLPANRVSKTDFYQQASLTATTPEELHRVEASLTTLEDKIEKLTVAIRVNAHEIMPLKVDLNQFQEERSEKTDGIITAIDARAQTVVDRRREIAAFFYQSQRQETTLANHKYPLPLWQRSRV